MIVLVVPAVPVTVTGVSTATGSVVIVNPTDVASAGTRTLAGTVRAALSLARETLTPVEPALGGPLSKATPNRGSPPWTLSGVAIRLARKGLRTVITAVRLIPFKLPVIVAEPSAVWANVVTVKVALLEPAGISTFAGTVARGAELDERVTV